MPDQPAPRRLALEVEQRNEYLTIVRCQGHLVSGLTDVLYSNVRPMIQANKRIVLDLSDLTWMDSMGLGTIVRLYVNAKSAKCALELINVAPRIQQLFGIAGLLNVFTTVGENRMRM